MIIYKKILNKSNVLCNKRTIQFNKLKLNINYLTYTYTCIRVFTFLLLKMKFMLISNCNHGLSLGLNKYNI